MELRVEFERKPKKGIVFLPVTNGNLALSLVPGNIASMRRTRREPVWKLSNSCAFPLGTSNSMSDLQADSARSYSPPSRQGTQLQSSEEAVLGWGSGARRRR